MRKYSMDERNDNSNIQPEIKSIMIGTYDDLNSKKGFVLKVGDNIKMILENSSGETANIIEGIVTDFRDLWSFDFVVYGMEIDNNKWYDISESVWIRSIEIIENSK